MSAWYIEQHVIMRIFAYAAVLKSLTYYAQNYAHVNELCLKSDCSIRVYLLVSKIVSVLLEYIKLIISMVSVLLEYIDLY